MKKKDIIIGTAIGLIAVAVFTHDSEKKIIDSIQGKDALLWYVKNTKQLVVIDGRTKIHRMNYGAFQHLQSRLPGYKFEFIIPGCIRGTKKQPSDPCYWIDVGIDTLSLTGLSLEHAAKE